MGGSGLQRPGDDRVQAAHQRERRAPDRRVQQDADVHAVHDDALRGVPSRGAPRWRAPGSPLVWLGKVTNLRSFAEGVRLQATQSSGRLDRRARRARRHRSRSGAAAAR